METADILKIFVVVIAANALTVGWFYCLWRLSKNEKDMRAILGFLAICGIVLFFVYASAGK